MPQRDDLDAGAAQLSLRMRCRLLVASPRLAGGQRCKTSATPEVLGAQVREGHDEDSGRRNGEMYAGHGAWSWPRKPLLRHDLNSSTRARPNDETQLQCAIAECLRAILDS